MKTKLAVVIGLLNLGMLAFATQSEALEPQTLEYRGEIIDSMCLDAHKGDLKNFVKTHTKDCVLAKQCRESGMNLYQYDGTLIKFDEASNKQIGLFLEKADSKLQVIVTAKKRADGNFTLVSIKNL